MTSAPTFDLLIDSGRAVAQATRIAPEPGEPRLGELLAHPGPRDGRRVHVRANMVASVDGGAWGADHRSGSINDVADLRVSVMGGPIFAENDPVYRGVRLPRQFWKILYYREGDDPTVRARGYVLTQEDLLSPLETLELPEFSVYEVAIAQIGEMVGLRLCGGEVLKAGVRGAGVRRIDSVRTIIRRPEAE